MAETSTSTLVGAVTDRGKEVEKILKYCRGVVSVDHEELKKIGM